VVVGRVSARLRRRVGGAGAGVNSRGVGDDGLLPKPGGMGRGLGTSSSLRDLVYR
jgi:hypothetical protein